MALLIAPPGCTQAVPSLKMTAPEGNSFSIEDVTVSVNISNFKVGDKQGKAVVKGEGHLIYFMDAGVPAIGIATAQDSYTWANVKTGTHIFTIELVNNDQTLLDPSVVARISVTVQ